MDPFTEYPPIDGSRPLQAQPLSDDEGWCIKPVPGPIVAEFYGPDAARLAIVTARFFNAGLFEQATL